MWRAEERAQWAKCLPCEDKDSSSDLQHQGKSWTSQCVPVTVARRGGDTCIVELTSRPIWLKWQAQ